MCIGTRSKQIIIKTRESVILLRGLRNCKLVDICIYIYIYIDRFI